MKNLLTIIFICFTGLFGAVNLHRLIMLTLALEHYLSLWKMMKSLALSIFLDGVTITGASGGSSQSNGFTVSTLQQPYLVFLLLEELFLLEMVPL